MTSAEEIKAKLDIVEVIREYLPALKPSGVNFVALSPFNREKTPSFVVSPEKQIWHDFSSGKGGDVFTFIMEMEGITFPEALRLLAPKAGVVLRQQNFTNNSQRNRVLDILEETTKYYYSNLIHSPEAEPARSYLRDRGLNQEMIDYWQIGFAKESWDDLLHYLLNKGFRADDIFAAGLSIRKPNKEFNRFRQRIMFPLSNINGNVVGFTGRVLPGGEETAKYMNSPQTIVYDKSKILFGLDKAKMAIKKQEYVIIVEGQMDVITAHQFGFLNVVAASGTALTPEQVKLLDRFTDNIIFALDADVAGQKAINRGEDVVRQFDTKIVEMKDPFGQVRRYIDPGKSYQKNIKVLLLPAGQDPDEFIRQNRDGWIDALRQAQPIMEYYFQRVLSGLDLEKVESKKKATKVLLPIISKLANAVDKSFWLKKLSNTIDIQEKFLYETLSEYEKKITGINKEIVYKIEPEIEKNRSQVLSETLLALILKFPVYIKYILDFLSLEQLVGEDNRFIYKNLILYYNENVGKQDTELDSFVLDYEQFNSWLDKNSEITPEQKQLVSKLFILAEKDFYNYELDFANKEIRQISKILKKDYFKKRLKAITQLIAELEKKQSDQNNKQELDSLLEEFNNLTEEIHKLN